MADKIFLRGGSWYRASAKQLPDDIDMDDIISNPSAQYPEIEGAEGGGGSQTLQEVLTEGSDAGGLTIDNLADPSTDQQSATKKYVDDNAGGLGYLVYTALLSQTGTDSPVATVFENTLGGTVVWTRQQAGVYIGTLTEVFIENKTICPPFAAADSVALPLSVNAFMDSGYILKRQDNDSVLLNSFDDSWTAAELSELIGGDKLFINIRVYP